jgi:hypothetical protein
VADGRGTTPGFITEKRFSMLDSGFFSLKFEEPKKAGGQLPTPYFFPKLKISSGDDSSASPIYSFSNTESQLHDETKYPN